MHLLFKLLTTKLQFECLLLNWGGVVRDVKKYIVFKYIDNK